MSVCARAAHVQQEIAAWVTSASHLWQSALAPWCTRKDALRFMSRAHWPARPHLPETRLWSAAMATCATWTALWSCLSKVQSESCSVSFMQRCSRAPSVDFSIELLFIYYYRVGMIMWVSYYCFRLSNTFICRAAMINWVVEPRKFVANYFCNRLIISNLPFVKGAACFPHFNCLYKWLFFWPLFIRLHHSPLRELRHQLWNRLFWMVSVGRSYASVRSHSWQLMKQKWGRLSGQTKGRFKGGFEYYLVMVHFPTLSSEAFRTGWQESRGWSHLGVKSQASIHRAVVPLLVYFTFTFISTAVFYIYT